jgi:hypothetical protein
LEGANGDKDRPEPLHQVLLRHGRFDRVISSQPGGRDISPSNLHRLFEYTGGVAHRAKEGVAESG